MIPPTLPADETARLQALRVYDVLDSEQDEAFDRITALAASLFDVPIALVSLIDENRQWFKSAHGLGAKETGRDISFCGHAILHEQPLVVGDALQDKRFFDNPLVLGDPSIRFYAGAPLQMPSGHKIGTLCLIDRRPRELSAPQQRVLSDLAALVINQLELRAARQAIAREARNLHTVLDVLPDGVALFDTGFHCVYANKALGDMFGLSPESILGWTPDNALRHVSTLTLTPPSADTDLRVVSRDTANAHVFHLVRPRLRVLRRSLHALSSSSHPWMSVWHDISHDTAQFERQQEEALTDVLTRLPNRRAMEARLALARAVGKGSVAMFDIDHFKRVNDTHGHGVGDEVLQLVARALVACTREGDMVGRWGGEEFISVLRADVAGARTFAERARRAVSLLETPAGPITISIGVAPFDPSADAVTTADEKLYEAKRRGRNRVCG